MTFTILQSIDFYLCSYWQYTVYIYKNYISGQILLIGPFK